MKRGRTDWTLPIAKRRKINEDLSDIEQKPESLTIPIVNANPMKWLALSTIARNKVASAFRHTYTLDGKMREVFTLHTHGEFKNLPTRVDPQHFQLEKFNIATKTEGGSALKYQELLAGIGGRGVGVRNAMRVLKGTHLKWELAKSKHDSESRAEKAVELAAEIGISEYNRGGTRALLNAMSGLYLMKHKRMTKSEFTDPTIGYVGAGKGGAKRLRELQAKSLPGAMHLNLLVKHYKETAVNKSGKAWSGMQNPKGFGIWLEHKARKWTQRQN